MKMADSKNKFIRIATALRQLVRDKEDTKQVFVILEALSGRSGERSYNKFLQLPHAERLLRSDKTLLDVLNDREWLKSLEPGSFGHAYYKFTEQEQITADGLVEASEEGHAQERDLTEDQIRFHTRNRDAHDLWHVLNGYGRDPLGELSLLAFTYKQMGNIGFLFIIGVGFKVMRTHAPGIKIWPAIREGFRRGKQAHWLGGAEWEKLLPLPLEDVREQLNISRPENYRRAVSQMKDLAPINLSPAE
jgi:ubiquinone biosynthesis protein COQ4